MITRDCFAEIVRDPQTGKISVVHGQREVDRPDLLTEEEAAARQADAEREARNEARRKQLADNDVRLVRPLVEAIISGADHKAGKGPTPRERIAQLEAEQGAIRAAME